MNLFMEVSVNVKDKEWVFEDFYITFLGKGRRNKKRDWEEIISKIGEKLEEWNVFEVMWRKFFVIGVGWWWLIVENVGDRFSIMIIG